MNGFLKQLCIFLKTYLWKYSGVYRRKQSSYEPFFQRSRISRGKFSIQQFLRLKELASNTVGVNNSIFDLELNTLLTLYKSLSDEINTLETEIIKLIEEVHPHYMSILGIAEAFYGIPAVLIAECKSRIDKGLMTDVLDEFDHVLGSRSVDTYSDEVDETQANQMIEAAIDKYY